MPAKACVLGGRDQEGPPHPHFRPEPVSTETVQVPSSSILQPLVRLLRQDILGSFQGAQGDWGDFQALPVDSCIFPYPWGWGQLG